MNLSSDRWGTQRVARVIAAASYLLIAGAAISGAEQATGPRWLEDLSAAAERGDLKASYSLGEVLIAGDATAADIPRGVSLLEKAARGGEAPAALRIGFLLMEGKVVSANETAAVAYFKAAAGGREMEAMHALGNAYLKGKGVKRSYSDALAWLYLAKENGDDSGAFEQVRESIAERRPDWVVDVDLRAEAIKDELAKSSVVELLPAPAEFV